MNRRCRKPWVLGFLLLSSGLELRAGAAPPTKVAAPTVAAPTVTSVVSRMQKVYEGTTDLKARFTQKTQSVMGKKEAEGEVLLKKPGKMRWDYQKPQKKLFVADGVQLWVYEPEDEQAFKQPLSSSQLPTQVSFLFGKGQLLLEFDITRLTGKAAEGLGGPDDYVLKLVPKAPTVQYRYLVFVVDLKTALVKETVVYDQQGGSNRISFLSIETNVKGGIDDARFAFVPPEGTQIIDPTKR